MNESPQIYTENFRVYQAECDMTEHMLPGTLLRLCQQIATDHCLVHGLDREFYQQTHTAFLLAKLTLRWQRTPISGETITLRTRPEKPRRAVYKRVTEVYDESGAEIALVDSRWVLVDTETRRILRRPPESHAHFPYAEEVDRELPIEFPRPEVLEDAGTAKATFTYCDVNGHMNNTHYADIACDAIPLQELKEKKIRQMSINFHSEIPAGESCRLERGIVEPGVWYVAGMRNDKHCFEAVVTLE